MVGTLKTANTIQYAHRELTQLLDLETSIKHLQVLVASRALVALPSEEADTKASSTSISNHKL